MQQYDFLLPGDDGYCEKTCQLKSKQKYPRLDSCTVVGALAITVPFCLLFLMLLLPTPKSH
jgi:hypothetical protein